MTNLYREYTASQAILNKKKAYERKVVLSRNEDFHTKGTFYHITTGAKHLPISFQT